MMARVCCFRIFLSFRCFRTCIMSGYKVYTSTQTPIDGPTKLFLTDLDGTLVVSKAGRRIATEDWTFVDPHIPAVLQKKAEEGWTIAIVTNQAEWTKKPTTIQKIEGVLAALQAMNGWAPWCLVATGPGSMYRKPARGLYDVLLTELHIESTSVKDLVYCGDAAGSEDPFPAFRWSASDRHFAEAIGATFLKPTELWTPVSIIPSETQEILLLVGNPGSGKSTIARLMKEKGYVHVEQDVLKTKPAILKVVNAALEAKKSMVIDATHGNPKNRKVWLDWAKKNGVSCRCIWHTRDGRSFNVLRETPVPEVAYAIYSKYFTVPAIDEGFSEVLQEY
jgi:bifunctional polynucleotide phosphatase/kinase